MDMEMTSGKEWYKDGQCCDKLRLWMDVRSQVCGSLLRRAAASVPFPLAYPQTAPGPPKRSPFAAGEAQRRADPAPRKTPTDRQERRPVSSLTKCQIQGRGIRPHIPQCCLLAAAAHADSTGKYLNFAVAGRHEADVLGGWDMSVMGGGTGRREGRRRRCRQESRARRIRRSVEFGTSNSKAPSERARRAEHSDAANSPDPAAPSTTDARPPFRASQRGSQSVCPFLFVFLPIRSSVRYTTRSSSISRQIIVVSSLIIEV